MAIWGLGALLVLMLVVAVGVAIFSSMKGSKTVTWILAGALLLVLAAGVAVLLKKQSALELEIVGPPGTAFVGEIIVDHTEHQVRGTVPQSFYYPGREISFVVIPVNNPDSTELEVRSNATRFKSFYGVRGALARENPLMFTEMVRGMTEPDWNAAAAHLLPEQGSAAEPPRSDGQSPQPEPSDGGI